MSANRRWMKFWPQDWQRDPALRSCGLAARGLWIEMLCIAHDATPFGHVTINGKAATIRQLAAIASTQEREVSRLLAELEEAGVFSKTDEGTIFSRRMLRDEEAAKAGRENVEKRWEKVRPPKKPNGTNTNTTPNRGGNTLYSEADTESESERKPPSEAKEKSGRKRQVPADWQPSEAGVQYARDRGLKQNEVSAFRNNHISKGNTFANLNRAWMTWCDKAVEFGRGRIPSTDLLSTATNSGVSV